MGMFDWLLGDDKPFEYRIVKEFMEKQKCYGKIGEQMEDESGIIHIPFTLPQFVTVDDLKGKGIIEKLETMTKKKVSVKSEGTLLLISFVPSNINKGIDYQPSFADQPLLLPFHRPLEDIAVNFHDDSNTHMLVGGASRMGKTKFLQYLILHLYRQCKFLKHDVHFFVATAKPNDFKVFKGLQEVTAISDEKETLKMLGDVIEISLQRSKVLDEYQFIKDAKDLNRKHPERSFTSIFVIIDEFGRYADNKDIRSAVEYIAETCGYLDIHLILASQRPDSKDVLSPRVTANLLTCMAFTTKNEANSKIILGMEGAEKLGGIPGKALLLDGPQAKEIFIPYVGDEEHDIYPLIRKWDGVVYAKRKFNLEYAQYLSNHEQGTDSKIDMQQPKTSEKYHQSNTVKVSAKTVDKKGGDRKKRTEPLLIEE